MSFVLAVFVGWYVVRSARRIERVREAIRARQSEIEAAARRAEQDAALGAMARILSHEIRNPLNCLALASKLLDREVAAHAAPSKRLVEVAATIASETNRLGDLVQGYLAHAEPRANDLIIEPVRLERVVEEVVGAVRPLFEASHVSIEIEGGTPETIPVDVGRIRTLLRELLENALEAVRVGGRVRITLGGDTRQATLAISDDGPGFADPEAALRPFYTTKSSGLGIGLALVRDIVRAHRGQIRARNLSPYGGASVEVGLPSGASA
jgi:signal transduction histidine kinase